MPKSSAGDLTAGTLVSSGGRCALCANVEGIFLARGGDRPASMRGPLRNRLSPRSRGPDGQRSQLEVRTSLPVCLPGGARDRRRAGSKTPPMEGFELTKPEELILALHLGGSQRAITERSLRSCPRAGQVTCSRRAGLRIPVRNLLPRSDAGPLGSPEPRRAAPRRLQRPPSERGHDRPAAYGTRRLRTAVVDAPLSRRPGLSPHQHLSLRCVAAAKKLLRDTAAGLERYRAGQRLCQPVAFHGGVQRPPQIHAGAIPRDASIA